MKNYNIQYSEQEPLWKSIPVIKDFTNLTTQHGELETHFQAYYCKQYIHFKFTAFGQEPKVYVYNNHKMEVCESERVEIFLRVDGKMSPYYCLEIDAIGRLLDYKAEYYRKFDYDWSWREPISIQSDIKGNCYIISGKLNISYLKELQILKNQKLQIGLFRGHCKNIIENKASMEWISWIKTNSIKPDFHISSAFGTFILKDEWV